MMPEKTLGELAEAVHGKVVGDPAVPILGIASFDNPKSGHLTFVTDPRKLKNLEDSPFAAFIVPPECASEKKPVIQSPHPKLAWATLLGLYHPPRTYPEGISDRAFVSKSAAIAKGVTIESYACVGENAVIGSGAVIRSHAFIDEDSAIGENTVIHPFVMIYPKTVIGSRVVIHAGAVIGADGFGYVFDGSKHAKIPQAGNVVIEDDVEIGPCTTIDRAVTGSTVIRQGVKIDNLVQIAHNVEVGIHSVLSAQTGISGSSKIGRYVTMGGRVGLGDHCEVGDQVTLGAQTGLPTGKKIPAGQTWVGAPGRPYAEMRKQVAAQLRSYETQQLVGELKKRLEALEKELGALKNAAAQS